MGSRLQILSPFQGRNDERLGTGTPWTLPGAGVDILFMCVELWMRV